MAPSSSPLDLSGLTSRGEYVHTVQIESPGGMKASIATLGARILELCLADGTSVLLRHKNLEQVAGDKAYINASVGRVANRIKNGRITRHKEMSDIQLPVNENGNTLHGGVMSWDLRLFSVTDSSDSSVEMHMLSPDGDNGFPSEVDVTVRYEFTGDEELTITLISKNVGDKLTLTNLTSHSYFDLTGNAGTVENSVLKNKIHAPRCGGYIVVDDDLIPTGEVGDVSGTRYDFRDARRLGTVDGDDDKFEGFDHYFVAETEEDPEGNIKPLVTVVGPPNDSGSCIELVVSSDQPGFQMYTGNFFDGSLDQGFAKCGCVAIEPSGFNDAANQPKFPSAELAPSETRRQIIRYNLRSVSKSE